MGIFPSISEGISSRLEELSLDNRTMIRWRIISDSIILTSISAIQLILFAGELQYYSRAREERLRVDKSENSWPSP